MEPLSILYAILPTISTGIFGVMIRQLNMKLDDHDRRIKAEEVSRKERLRQREEEHQALCKGLQVILRNEIISMYHRWQKNGKQDLPIFERDILMQTYDAYHRLGGNGTITDIINEITGGGHDFD